MKLKNYMEEMVFEYIDQVLQQYSDVCDCDRCRLDIAAIALNDLPPKYYVTQQGEIYSKSNELNQQFKTDVITALSKAVNRVQKNPNH